MVLCRCVIDGSFGLGSLCVDVLHALSVAVVVAARKKAGGGARTPHAKPANNIRPFSTYRVHPFTPGHLTFFLPSSPTLVVCTVSLSPNQWGTLPVRAPGGGGYRTTAYEEFPGLKSAVRVQECISVLGDNPVAKRLGNFALSSLNPVLEGQGQARAERKRLEEDSVIDVGEGGGSSGGGDDESGNRKGGMTFAPLKVSSCCCCCCLVSPCGGPAFESQGGSAASLFRARPDAIVVIPPALRVFVAVQVAAGTSLPRICCP